MVKTLAESVYNSILCICFVGISLLTSFTPKPIGPIIYFIQLAWLYSFYCFEYALRDGEGEEETNFICSSKWTLEGKKYLGKRLLYFEERWAYMLGFGIPLSFSTPYFFPPPLFFISSFFIFFIFFK